MKRRNFLYNFIISIISFFFGYKIGNASEISNENESLSENNENIGILREIVVSITDKRFGAKGDGRDESKQIQAAINYVAAKGGGSVIIPNGTFKGNITISKSNIHIEGKGTLKGTINLFGTETIGVSRFDEKQGTGDISINGITIDGGKVRNGINLKWVFGITIAGVTFKHCIKSIHFEPVPETQHCSRITITKNRIWDCNYGLYVAFDPKISSAIKYQVGDIIYTDNVHESRNSGWAGSFGNHYHIWAKGLDGLVCKGNTFFFSDIGRELSNIHIELFNWVIIEGNQLFEAKEHGIKAVNGDNLIISNNNFSWTKKQSVWLSGISTCSISGNNITWNDDPINLKQRTGVYIENSPYFVGNVSNNNFLFPNEHAIHIRDSSHIVISGNNSRNKYSKAEPVKIDSLNNCTGINITGNHFSNYEISMQTILGKSPPNSLITYTGNS